MARALSYISLEAILSWITPIFAIFPESSQQSSGTNLLKRDFTAFIIITDNAPSVRGLQSLTGKSSLSDRRVRAELSRLHRSCNP